jgi:pyruvate formate lyase activating enzyme
MEGIIFDIKRFAVHDGPGIRTTVFFKGCPLECAWCHNPESKTEGITEMEACYKIGKDEKRVIEKVGRSYRVEELVQEIKKDLIVMEESGGGVTMSGGEPLMQFKFLKELLMQLKASGIHTCVDTTGCANGNTIEEIMPYTDLFLYDLKHYDEKEHVKNTGVSLKPIIQNLEILLNGNKKVWLRIPVIPNMNDSHEDRFGFLFTIQNLIKKPDQINLLPFHNIAGNKYDRLNTKNVYKDKPSLETQVLKPFVSILKRSGYTVKTGG